MSEWYKQSRWRNLVDMHIPDWHPAFLSKFDPQNYADLLAVSEADCAIIYAGNCLGYCFWPTQAGHMHTGLQGRDIVAETVKACQAKGMNTVVYFNIWNRFEFDRHPDWRLRYIDGRDTTQGVDGSRNRYGNCCLNHPDFRAFVRSQIEDLVDRYACDGLWIDMIGWNGTICYCPSCRKRYMAETGSELPVTVNWSDAAWVRFQRRREAWFTDFTQMIEKTLHERKPEVTVAFQCGTSLGGWIGGASQAFLDLSDYLAGDFDSNALTCSTICKILSSATRNKPVEFMTARCTSLADHTTIKSYQQFRQNVAVALSRNCAFCFIDAIDPMGTLNRRFYEQMGQLHREMQVYLDAIAPDATLLRDVSIFHNLESGIDVSMNNQHISQFSNTIWGGSIGTQLPRLRNIAQALIADHLAFDIGCPHNLDEMLIESQVVVVPDQMMLSDEQINQFKQFVQEGGSLVLTGRSGYCDNSGRVRTDDSLVELTGVRLLGDSDEDVVYFSPTGKNASLFTPADRRYPLLVNHQAVLVESNPDVEVLARLTLPCSRTDNIVTFGSAISNPPWRDTAYPAVTLHAYGQGQVLYLAAPLEAVEHEVQQAVFCKLIRFLMKHEPLVTTDAPAWMEILAYRDDVAKRYLVYACKTMEEYQDMSAGAVSLSLRLPVSTGRLCKIGAKSMISYTRHADKIAWLEPEMGDFTLYQIEMT